ncbi:putative inorganic carbon transporter subunit DabA [Clavibacter nebraskensis]|uniref:putative inorganic carbon transporter subunit DabA n=1 Tax=Clavibacter nebraskensis TaxID=31963 RepID=UPI001F1C18D3|nr:putative inorganic carbon transporter subunit DabA [Clavibacter nebraskensis]UKF28296.1 DUF2309 domain-containing protein [Clavibacter nebraskensis]UQB13684.1 DUF2309 domain-containing protein [Clavibacter nebraskensis]UQB16519.1 DUF2309 domain-containing protein [Clavibacter nebraskensis]
MTTLSPPQVRAHVAGAARSVAPTWPLTSFIAVNPMSGYQDRPFHELAASAGECPAMPEAHYLRAAERGEIPPAALRAALQQVVPELARDDASGGSAIAALDIAMAALRQPPPSAGDEGAGDDAGEPADQHLASVLARFHADPVWAPPAAGSLYARFRDLSAHDPALPRRARRALAALPESPEGAIAEIMALHGITPQRREPVMAQQLHALPGWASHIAWRATRVGDATLTDLVACRLSLLHVLGLAVDAPVEREPRAPALDRHWALRVARTCAGTGVDGVDSSAYVATARVLRHLDPTTRRMVWQTATEVAYRDGLMAELERAARARAADAVSPPEPVEAQVVFCIDTRSEGLRRHLEEHAGIRTLGIAGFFGVPLRHTPLFARSPREQFPALLSDGVASGERAVDPEGARRAGARAALAGAARSVVRTAAGTPASAFGWAEMAGWVSLLSRLARAVAGALGGEAAAPPATTVDVCERLSLDERAAVAESILRMMGLTDFAPLVVLAGHRSATRNNLHRAALDCGACGGNAGGVNARAAAAICDDPAVRGRLAERGLRIPDGTWFVAAEHETTTDAFHVLDDHLIPDSHRGYVDRVRLVASVAGHALVDERRLALPGGSRQTVERVRRRAEDRSEMYPEAGLADNAALIIAPREITRGADLGRRVFLHDYDPAADPDGSALTNIMTAPLIVAQWINAQYYFSTIHPHRHGAGSKTVHNPVGDIGVIAGHTGDLRTGLPWQSVAAGDELLHTPLRLSVLIQAPLDRVERIVSATDALRSLLDGGWITLHAREDADHPWRQHRSGGFTTDERNHA